MAIARKAYPDVPLFRYPYSPMTKTEAAAKLAAAAQGGPGHKGRAIAAAPLAAVVPGAAMAMDDSAARLARIVDEREIEALHRATGRSVDVRGLAKRLVALHPDPATSPQIILSADGRRATASQPCRAEFESEVTGHTTVERMTRFQGHGSGRTSEQRTLVAEYVKKDTGWDVAKLRLA